MRIAISTVLLWLSAIACAEPGTEIVVKSPESDSGDAEFTIQLVESDFRAAYSAVMPSDKMLPVCFNSMAGGAIKYRFIREPSEHRVDVLSSDCRVDSRGLVCKPLVTKKLYYFQSPEYQVELGPGVSFSEAEALYDAYGADGIEEIPEWYRGLSRDHISLVERLPDAFRITFGDVLCTHCVATFVVRLEWVGSKQVLRLQGEPEGMCV